jgi:hypothetical protein
MYTIEETIGSDTLIAAAGCLIAAEGPSGPYLADRWTGDRYLPAEGEAFTVDEDMTLVVRDGRWVVA